jgi:hypothetical protein
MSDDETNKNWEKLKMSDTHREASGKKIAVVVVVLVVIALIVGYAMWLSGEIKTNGVNGKAIAGIAVPSIVIVGGLVFFFRDKLFNAGLFGARKGLEGVGAVAGLGGKLESKLSDAQKSFIADRKLKREADAIGKAARQAHLDNARKGNPDDHDGIEYLPLDE